jgi:hypothetical protein
MGMAHSMLKVMVVPGWFWWEAVATAINILNCSPTQSVKGCTPYEVWHDIRPSVHHFCTFGCIAHVKKGNKRLAKLEDRGTTMVFVGYEPGSKSWRFYNPNTKLVHVSRDAMFEENRPWNWSSEERGTLLDDEDPFTVEVATIRG